jgi:uncharacterized membrane protein
MTPAWFVVAAVKPVWLVGAVAVAALLIWRRHKLEPTLLAGGAIAAVLMAVYGSGLIQLPNLGRR